MYARADETRYNKPRVRRREELTMELRLILGFLIVGLFLWIILLRRGRRGGTGRTTDRAITPMSPAAWATPAGVGASQHKSAPGSRSGPVGTIDGPGTFSVEVVGESHYQVALERICGGRTEDGVEKHVVGTLILEDGNPHDDKAVRVHVEGHTVGYLPRKLAREYRQRLEEAGHPALRGMCSAVIRGGWDRGSGDRGNFGVWLDLPVED